MEIISTEHVGPNVSEQLLVGLEKFKNFKKLFPATVSACNVSCFKVLFYLDHYVDRYYDQLFPLERSKVISSNHYIHVALGNKSSLKCRVYTALNFDKKTMR